MEAGTCPNCGATRLAGVAVCGQCWRRFPEPDTAPDVTPDTDPEAAQPPSVTAGPIVASPGGPLSPPPPPGRSSQSGSGWPPPPPPPPPPPHGTPPHLAQLRPMSGGWSSAAPVGPPGPERSERRTAAYVAIVMVVVVALIAGTVQLVSRPGGVAARPTSTPRPSAAQAIPTPSATPRPTRAPGPASFAPGTKVIKIGVTLPLGLVDIDTPGNMLKGVQLAVDEANEAGTVPGVGFGLVTLDHTLDGTYSIDKGAADLATLVSDAAVMGVVGPFNSAVAQEQIPVSNRAHLLQCSPSTMYADLTVGRGPLLRPLGPETNNFIRMIAPDLDEGIAMAHYAYDSLGRRLVAVANDGNPYGTSIAKGFTAEFRRLGGSVALEFTVDTASLTKDLTKARAKGVDAVFFGGDTDTGGADVRRTMGDLTMGDLPLLVGDGVMDGDSSVGGSYLNEVGYLAAKTYAALPEPDPMGDGEAFFNAYSAAFGSEGTFYSMGAYSCAQVLIASIQIAEGGTLSREAVRAAAVGSGHAFDTALGLVKFNAAGDMTPGSVSIYEADLSKSVAAASWSYVVRMPLAKP